MMIRLQELTRIKDGEIDLAFRRWDRPRVVVGTRLRTAVGLIEVTSVEQVTGGSLRASDASRSGHPTLASLKAGLSARAERPLFRIGLTFAGPDPRDALRESIPGPEEMQRLHEALDRLDRASPVGPWTRVTLELIDNRPEMRAPELATELGRPTAEFKRDVRKLKEKGLTESLAIGYRLSPRGEAVLDHGGPGRHRLPRPKGSPLPRIIGAPATRALRAEGLTSLELVATRSRASLSGLHGVGPIALERLDSALDEHGLTYS